MFFVTLIENDLRIEIFIEKSITKNIVIIERHNKKLLCLNYHKILILKGFYKNEDF